ncbi:MAG: acyl-CoA dehydrogenase family protein [Polyangiaceae bacterium]|nr:acyl-CoA dehydrogenase family protein [Polyangiaceae bacterium]
MQLEIPKSLRPLVAQARQVGQNLFRPIARKYDTKEHAYPRELDMLAALLDGLSEAGVGAAVGARRRVGGVKRGGHENLAAVLATIELCWGDVGLALTIPRQGLGNAALAAVATPEQRARFGQVWAAMAITEPEAGSDSAAIRTTARDDGGSWVIDGEKIFVTAGSRADAIVVWATVDKSLGRAGIKPFIVPAGTRGMELTRLDKKLGIRASDTAMLTFRDCRIPKGNLLGSPEIEASGFAGVMETFDNTRPIVAGMAIGVARAALELTRAELAAAGVRAEYEKPLWASSAAEAELYRMEAELESARLLTLSAAHLADRGVPNSMQASMAKAKAARVANAITLRCVELTGDAGYAERELLEKWARDSKILDIFEGTQQIQLLIVARKILGLRSSELR